MSTTTPTRPRSSPPWFARPLGAVWVAAVLLLVFSALSPAVRHQLALSATRQDQPYVALWLADGEPAQACTAGQPVRFRLARHGASGSVRYQVVVGRIGSGAQPFVYGGQVEATDGTAVPVTVPVPARAARGAHDVQVAVEGSRAHLSVHCPAGRA